MCRQSVKQRRKHIVRQMVEELARSIDSDLARGTARHDYTLAAFCDGRRVVYEVSEIVALNLALDRDEQSGLLHGGSDWLDR
jgi:hypothetical protein